MRFWSSPRYGQPPTSSSCVTNRDNCLLITQTVVDTDTVCCIRRVSPTMKCRHIVAIIWYILSAIVSRRMSRAATPLDRTYYGACFPGYYIGWMCVCLRLCVRIRLFVDNSALVWRCKARAVRSWIERKHTGLNRLVLALSINFFCHVSSPFISMLMNNAICINYHRS